MVAFRYEYGVKKNEAKTLEAGRPVFDEVIYCRFTNPDGDRVFEVNKAFRENFLVNKQPANKEREQECQTLRDALERFERDGEEVVSGFPVREWAMASRTEIASLEAMGIRTLEEIVAMDDAACKHAGIPLPLRDKAKEYLEAGVDAGKAASKLAKLAEDLRAANETISDLKRQLAEAKDRISELMLGGNRQDEPKGKKAK